MKQTYRVRVYLSTFYDVEVEAENASEAMREAESSEYWNLADPLNMNLQEGETEIIDGDGDDEPIEEEDIPSGCRMIKVDWDTDGQDPEELDLPEIVSIPIYTDDDDVTDVISDYYGYCIKSWEEV